MTPEISEFSYGFALTNEIVGWAPLSAAPIFPSLIEEGRAGGGYDVRLDRPGVPLYLQFKRADCMTRKSAWEIRDHNLQIARPFYRFKITEYGKSNQHRLLLALDDGANDVFYAAPRFHRIGEINAAWAANQVASRSIFVTPKAIGSLDFDSHHVAYDLKRAYLCSEPKRIEYLTSGTLVERLGDRLSNERRSIGDSLPELIKRVEHAKDNAEKRARPGTEAHRETPRRSSERIATPERRGAERFAKRVVEPSLTPPLDAVPTRPPRRLNPIERQLRELADLTAKIFNAQLVIVQERD